MNYRWIVEDIIGFDSDLLLTYISLIYWPVVLCLVLPASLLVLIYTSSLFLTIYKWSSHLQEAYHRNFWDGARQTLAVFWEAQATIWHGKSWSLYIFNLRFVLWSSFRGWNSIILPCTVLLYTLFCSGCSALPSRFQWCSRMNQLLRKFIPHLGVRDIHPRVKPVYFNFIIILCLIIGNPSL